LSFGLASIDPPRPGGLRYCEIVRFRLPHPRRFAQTVRELARRSPEEAEAYLDTHQDEWEALVEDYPHDAADILEALDEEGAADLLLTDLDLEEIGDVLDEMRPQSAADVLEEIDPGQAADFIEAMEPDQAADLVAALDDEAREAILAHLEPEAAVEINRLLEYPADSAGGLMTTDIAYLPSGMSAGESIEALRRLHEELGSNLQYVYVVDDRHRLLGVVSFRDLVFARPGTGLDEVMVHDPVHVHTMTDREEVTELIQRYHLLAVPVIDDGERLVGMVRFDEALEAVQAEATEDITQMVGAGSEEGPLTPIRISIRRRLPWIFVNLLIGLVIAFAIDPFRTTIEEEPILAVLMPMVALLGGNSGAQSLAVIIRAMAVGALPRGRAMRAVRREFTIGLLNGIVIATLAGVGARMVAGITGAPQELGIVVALAVFAAMLTAGLAGAGIPVLMRRMGLDPALASNIFLTTITDLVGFGGFLLTATALL
jgi:magnesium transporter